MLLRGREQVVSEQYVRTVAAAIAARRGAPAIDRRSNLLAHLCYLVLRLSLAEWLQESRPPPLEQVIASHFDLLAADITDR
jgi:hypothetical protein